MPIIGLLDIIVAFVCLYMDTCPLVYCWTFVWGFATAAIRPLAGESIFEFVGRTGNFCPALALLWLSTGQHFGFYFIMCMIMTGTLAISGLILRLTALLND
jgi:hypothetical protein